MELILVLLVSYYLANNLFTNIAYAVRGLDPPRHKERMARIERGGQAVAGGYRSGRNGASRFFAELWHDSWDDAHAKRQELRERRQEKRAAIQLQAEPTEPVDPAGRPVLPNGEVDTPGALRPQDPDNNVIPLDARGRQPTRATRAPLQGACWDCGGPAELGRFRCPSCAGKVRLPNGGLDAPDGRRPGPYDDQAPRVQVDVLETPDALRLATGGDSEPWPSRKETDQAAAEPSAWFEQPHERPAADQGGPAEPKETQEGNHMSVMTSNDAAGQPTGEIVGLGSAIRFAEGMANSMRGAAANTETSVAALHGSEVGEGPIAALHQAQEATIAAALAYENALAALRQQMSVKEAYDATPDAGNKQFLLTD